MKRSIILLGVLLSCLGSFLGAHPALAEQGTATPGDPFIHMIQEGWRIVAPGVLQRDLGTGKVETLGLGAEGLRFKMEAMKAHLRDLRAELRLHPTPELRMAVRSYRAEIERLRQALKTAAAADELESANEKLAAGIDCTIKYGAHVDAYALTTSQGVGAKADSYFNSNCGQVGEVYAHATGRATGADGVLRQATKTDPATGIRSGGNVSATATITVNGVSACYSYAYASMTSYDLGIVYEQSVENTTCPAPPLTVTVSKSYAYDTLHIYGYDCYTVTWTASASGGSSPFTYAWTLNGAAVGSNSSTYTKQFCGQDTETTYTANVTVTVTDSAGQTKSASRSQAIAYHMTL
jgi:hypothetical protein